ncbi:probable carboxylesterase 2 [Lactuca sativa]|uniref:probable carboxylesterase 2 n=1 Tax=Lactuca sativa TaxID=4236 RepID=UPI000CD8891A|nr:probable carboxylesterase 2 [Lactuca sativa]
MSKWAYERLVLFSPNFLQMDSSSNQIVKEIPGVIRVYKDGRFQKLAGTDVVPAGIDPSSGVQSKDVIISPETNLSARLYLPKTPTKKLPLLIYIHGGGFIIDTAASPLYHDFLNLIAAESNVVIVSVDYRTAPEYPVPTCFNDSWEAIKWVAGNCPEPWLNDYADRENVFFAGDSAGANIAHQMAIRVGLENPCLSINLCGIILLHPYFWGKDRIGSEGEDPRKTLLDDMWIFAHPGTSGLDDPLINPAKDPNLSDLGCSRVLVCVAEKDIGKNRGWYYKDNLGKNGWNGDIEVIEDRGEDHVFFLFNPSANNASTLRRRICTFINHMDN